MLPGRAKVLVAQTVLCATRADEWLSGPKKGGKGGKKDGDTKTDMGKITNLMENDAGKVSFFDAYIVWIYLNHTNKFAAVVSNMYHLYGGSFLLT